jgi:hypothetical protein
MPNLLQEFYLSFKQQKKYLFQKLLEADFCRNNIITRYKTNFIIKICAVKGITSNVLFYTSSSTTTLAFFSGETTIIPYKKQRSF